MPRYSLQQESEWVDKINQWFRSGKSAKAWCRENRVVYTTFIGWRNRLKRKQKQAISEDKNSVIRPKQFIELKDRTEEAPTIVLECCGVRVHISADFDSALLRKCLDVLRGCSC